MNAIRTIITREEFQLLEIPQSFGQKFEVIILPVETEISNKIPQQDFTDIMKLQETSGFLTKLYSDNEEDVWNNV